MTSKTVYEFTRKTARERLERELKLPPDSLLPHRDVVNGIVNNLVDEFETMLDASLRKLECSGSLGGALCCCLSLPFIERRVLASGMVVVVLTSSSCGTSRSTILLATLALIA